MEDEIRKVSECINRGRNYFNYMIQESMRKPNIF